MSPGSTTEIKTVCWPTTTADLGGVSVMCGYGESPTIITAGTDLDRIYRGLIDEDYDLDPANILGAWITPICPFPEIFELRTASDDFITIYYWIPKDNTASIVKK